MTAAKRYLTQMLPMMITLTQPLVYLQRENQVIVKVMMVVIEDLAHNCSNNEKRKKVKHR